MYTCDLLDIGYPMFLFLLLIIFCVWFDKYDWVLGVIVFFAFFSLLGMYWQWTVECFYHAIAGYLRVAS